MPRYNPPITDRYNLQKEVSLDVIQPVNLKPIVDKPSTPFQEFFGKKIMQFFVGDEVLENQKKNWESLIKRAKTLQENETGFTAPSDPAWMQVNGMAYTKYIVDLSAEHPDNIMQELYQDSFTDTVEIVKDQVKEVASGTNDQLKWAIAGFIALVVFQIWNTLKFK